MKSSQPAFKPFGNPFKVSAMNLNEAAQLVSCSRRLLEKQIAIGRLKTIRISSRCVRIRPEDLAEFLEKNAVRVFVLKKRKARAAWRLTRAGIWIESSFIYRRATTRCQPIAPDP